MGFSVPAISCVLSLPSNTSLFYLKIINSVAVNVHQTSAVSSATLHVTKHSTVCCAMSWMIQRRSLYIMLQAAVSECSPREGNKHEINLCPPGQQHVVSKLISYHPLIIWCHVKESKRASHISLLLFWSHCDWLISLNFSRGSSFIWFSCPSLNLTWSSFSPACLILEQIHSLLVIFQSLLFSDDKSCSLTCGSDMNWMGRVCKAFWWC